MSRLILAVALTCSAIAAGPKNKYISANGFYDTIPHVVDGASWKTTITLVNLDTATRKYKLVFYGDDGAPKAFSFVGRGSGSSFSGEIPRGGIAVFETLGSSSTLNSGWAATDGIGTDYEVGMSAVFSSVGIPGRPDFEATVPASNGIEYDGILPFDNTRGFVTSAAVLNPSRFSSYTMPVAIYDETGALLKNDTLTIQPGRKIAFETPARWAETAGKRGTIQFGGSLASWAVLGFRFNPGGAFTTVNVMEP